MRASRGRVSRPSRGLLGRLGRPVPGAWRRTSSLAAAGALALITGVGTGLASGVVADAGAPAEVDLLSGPPDECPVVQAAWSRSASLQLGLSADDPATLRRGFVGAHEALASVHPPPAVREDWLTVLTYVGTVAEEVEGADEADLPAVVGETLSRLDTAGMTAASERVTTYLKAGCGESTPSEEPSEEPAD